MPKMHEPGIVKRRSGLEAGDMPAEFGRRLVGAQHDGRGVPADNRTNLVLEDPVARMCRLILRRDGVHIGRVGRKGQLCTLAPGGLNDAVQQFIDPADAFKGLDGIRAHPAIHVFQWDRDPGPMFLSPCGDAFRTFLPSTDSRRSIWFKRCISHASRKRNSDPRAIYLNLFMIFHRSAVIARAGS